MLVMSIEIVLLIIDFISKDLFNHRRRVIYLLMGSCALMSALLCFPALMEKYSSESYKVIKSIVFSINNAIRVFMSDNIYENISDQIEKLVRTNGTMHHQYAHLFEVYEFVVLAIQLIAPFLTFGFVISFIKNFVPGLKYGFFFWREKQVFSELNVKTVILADSILKNASEKEKNAFKRWFFKPLVVFTGCEKKDKDDELLDKAREMGAVIFNSNIDSVRFKRFLPEDKVKKDKESSTKKKVKQKNPKKVKETKRKKVEKKKSKVRITFYLTGEHETEKINYATHIIKRWDYDEVAMYVFSDTMECEMLLSAWDNKKMQIYRVNDIQALIYHNLYANGIRLFDNAHKQNNNTISAVIVGLGRYGIEMLKALVWYCQVPGFKIKITVFDEDEDIEAKFKAQCPELIEKNRDKTEGEAYYDINIYGGVDVSRYDFYEKLNCVSDPTYIFVCLGKDEENIDVAVRIRSEYCKIAPNMNPDIETVVYDTNITREMSVTFPGDLTKNSDPGGIKNFKGQAYNIHMIGDLESFYSVKTVINSELIEAGKVVNSRWANTAEDKVKEEKKFWKYNYHYKSSIAKAIHEALRVKLVDRKYIQPIKGLGKAWEELNDEEKLEIGLFEHVRWNAYMRSEGYCYSETRNDLTKTHDKLVSVKKLTDDDLRKDA